MPKSFQDLYLSSVEELHESTRLNSGNIADFRKSTSKVNGAPELVEFYTKFMFKKYIGSTERILPPPVAHEKSFDSVVENRRSVRNFIPYELTSQQLGNVLGTALNVSGTLRRPYPSAGGIYSVEHYVVIPRDGEIKSGVYHYEPRGSVLHFIRSLALEEFAKSIDMRAEQLHAASFVIVQTVSLDRHISKYLGRGYRFSMIEVGLASQMLSLSAAAYGLGALNWGGGFDAVVESQLEIDNNEEVMANIIVFGQEA